MEMNVILREKEISMSWNAFKKTLPGHGFWLPKQPIKDKKYDIRHPMHRVETPLIPGSRLKERIPFVVVQLKANNFNLFFGGVR